MTAELAKDMMHGSSDVSVEVPPFNPFSKTKQRLLVSGYKKADDVHAKKDTHCVGTEDAEELDGAKAGTLKDRLLNAVREAGACSDCDVTEVELAKKSNKWEMFTIPAAAAEEPAAVEPAAEPQVE